MRRLVRLDPHNILAAAKAPLGEQLPAALEPIGRAVADPEEDKARIGGERGDREREELLPGHLRVLRVDEDHVELARVQRAQLREGQERGPVRARVHRDPLEREQLLLLRVSVQ